jgi:hypothetical protein
MAVHLEQNIRGEWVRLLTFPNWDWAKDARDRRAKRYGIDRDNFSLVVEAGPEAMAVYGD